MKTVNWLERANPILYWRKLELDERGYNFFTSMMKNDKGAGQYIFHGAKTYAGYVRIPLTNWYFGISAPKTQVFKSTNQIYFFVVLLLFLALAIFSAAHIYITILRRNLEAEKNIAIAAVNTANLIIIGMNKEGVIYDFNRYAEVKLGYEKAKVADNLKLKDMVVPEAMSSYNELMDHIMDGKSLSELELPLKSKAGENIYILWDLASRYNHNDEYFEIVGMDISDRIKVEEILREQYEELSEKEKKINRLAYFDSLTGLPNRTNLKSCFTSNILGKKTKAALLYIDLDNFKNVNDTFGHTVGDGLLIQVAGNIKSILKDGNTAARLGGDDFIILIADYKNLNEVKLIADKLLKSFQSSFRLGDSIINISTSIGIALYPYNGQTFGELMRCADTALHAAKEAGKRKYVFFNQNMYDSIAKKMDIQNSMRKAIENKEFILHYQPQYEIKTRKVRGFEALLRWKSPEHGFILPVDFIGVAESSGLIIALGEWVLDEACSFMKHIIDTGHKDISISVNVSVIQLLQENFVPMVARILKEKDLEPSCLELEITESVLIENIDLSLKKINELRALGVKVSLDDFGTGYSSLTYLRDLPINILKIDKLFIDNILSIDEKNGLVGSIITLAHDLGLEVVAEGVENEEQLRYLEWYNCEMVQGYLFSKPLPKEKAIELFRG